VNALTEHAETHDVADESTDTETLSIVDQVIASHDGYEAIDVVAGLQRAKLMKAPPTQREFDASYPRISLVNVVEPAALTGASSVADTIAGRTSHRDYARRSMTLGELAFILRASIGTKGYRSNAYNVHSYPISNAPSAGGLQPLNVYVYVSDVEGLADGVYYYAPRDDELVTIWQGRPDVDLAKIFVTDFSPRAQVSIVMTGDIRRFAWKYGYRGYRLLNVDCGVAAGYIGLVAESVGIGSCPVAAFSSKDVVTSLGLEREELPLLCLSMGPKREQ